MTTRLEKRVDVPVPDLSLIRGLWEVRVKKYKHKLRTEKERVEKSALVKINKQWQYRIHCKALKSSEVTLLHHYLDRTTLQDIQPCQETDSEAQDEDSRFIFELDGDKWTKLPDSLEYMTYLREWHIRGTRIQQLPDYIMDFQDLTVLEIPKNGLRKLPVEIGKLTQLRELNVNYNKLSSVPPELGDCESLERLELTGNLSLRELPFELSSLKKLKHLDLAENMFASIPICALRMSSLQLLDLSNNQLTDLPEDMDRLQELDTLFVHKNRMSYLPLSLSKLPNLKMVVVSADELNSYPSKLTESSDIKFIRLYDNPFHKVKGEEEAVRKEDHEKEFMQTYINSLQDRETVPYSTTKVSISCLL
ncbi:leucine-rich repeat-containing protein 2 isoform X2 [Hypomesus transpacificus]|nr:leucine-rich repeat-containing protein 2 isoform X2 [Hypomesus transpacificus]